MPLLGRRPTMQRTMSRRQKRPGIGASLDSGSMPRFELDSSGLPNAQARAARFPIGVRP